MRIRVALILGPDDDMLDLREMIQKPLDYPFDKWKFLKFHCKRAETPPEKDQQAKRIQKEISSYLKGGTRKIAGITGKEKVGEILKRIRDLKISGSDKLIQRLGKSRYEELLKGAKADLIKGWLSLRKARGIEIVPRQDLKKIPEDLRKASDILVFEDRLIRKESGFSRWERVEGGRYWRDSHGRYSKGPKDRKE